MTPVGSGERASLGFAEGALEAPPPPGTVERWAWDYVLSTDLAVKLDPPEIPRRWESPPRPRRLAAPGRPKELSITKHAAKTPGPEAMRSPQKRAQLVHTFLHHELQATELFAWAVLAFADAPRPFRGGLLHIAKDEIRHMRMYRDYLATLGCAFGDYPVRDWFWERVPSARAPAELVAVLGVGFEGANLDHTARFAERFRAIGDEPGARLQETVGREEIAHVRFARRWLRRFTGTDDFEAWLSHLPPPLSPILMRGKPIDRARRLEAGLSEAFLDDLARWEGDRRSP